MKNMRVFKRQVGGYMSALEKSRPELYKTIKAYRDRLDKPGEQKTFDKRANIQFATSLNMPKQMREAYYASIEKQFAKPSEEQLKKIQEQQSAVTKILNEVGYLEANKHGLLHE